MQILNRFSQNGLLVFAAVLLLVGAVGAGCDDEDSSTPDPVISLYDHTADFGIFETFMIVEPPEGTTGDKDPVDLTDGDQITIDTQITQELEALGLTKVTAGADLQVSSFVTIEKMDAAVTGYWYEYYWYGWYWYYYDQWYYNDEVEFDAGSLVIDAFATYEADDDEDDRLVFRGMTMGIVSDDAASERTERLQDAVSLVLGDWPESEEEE